MQPVMISLMVRSFIDIQKQCCANKIAPKMLENGPIVEKLKHKSVKFQMNPEDPPPCAYTTTSSNIDLVLWMVDVVIFSGVIR